MKIYDVFVVGGGKSGAKIAAGVAAAGRKTGLLQFPDGREDRHLRALENLDRILDKSSVKPAPIRSSSLSYEKFRGTGHFTGPDTFQIGEETIQSKRFVLASGSLATEPDVPGFTKCPYETPDTWDGIPQKDSALVIGGGPLAASTALALARQKVETSLIASPSRMLLREDEELSQSVEAILKSAGVRIYKNAKITQAKPGRPKNVTLQVEAHGEKFSLQARRLFLAAGARPATSEIGLDVAGVYVDKDGRIITTETMATSNPKILALGPAAGAWHAGLEEFQVDIAINNLTSAFFAQNRLESDHWPFSFPFVPAFARIGLTEIEAVAKASDARSLVHPLPEKNQWLKIIGRKKSGEILGIHCLGTGAREIILYFDLARRAGISLYDLVGKQHIPAPGRTSEVAEAVSQWGQV